MRSYSNYQDVIAEEEDGPRAPARLKSYDQRFNFYPSFPVERSMVLDFRAEQIHHLRIEIQAQTERIKSRYNVKDPCILPLRNKQRKKFVKRMSLLAEQIEKYSKFSLTERSPSEHGGTVNELTAFITDIAMVNSKILNDCQIPEGTSLLELQTHLERRSRSQLPQYQSDKTSEFRLLEPKRGPIEKAVKVFMPLHWLGQWLLVRIAFTRIFLMPPSRNMSRLSVDVASLPNFEYAYIRSNLPSIRRCTSDQRRGCRPADWDLHFPGSAFGPAFTF